MKTSRAPLLSAALLALVPFSLLAQDQDESAGDKALRERWLKTYQAIAASIEMRQGETALTLHDQPLLFYTNPVRTTDQHGTIFLWTDKGRPAIFGSIWSAVNQKQPELRNVTHEFHSLSEASDVQAVRAGARLWSADEPGISWLTLPDSPAPAATRPARLVQMRNLARRLSARINSNEPTDLRMMSQPLYRYSEKVPGAVDGALFAFSLATDPELIAWMEAREQAWHVAFARFGALPMSVAEGERIIWSCEKATARQRTGRYYLMWGAEEMSINPQEAK